MIISISFEMKVNFQSNIKKFRSQSDRYLKNAQYCNNHSNFGGHIQKFYNLFDFFYIALNHGKFVRK